ncbi:MAG TPA: putative metal-dependent hydrolase [Bacteroidia bacterium]
MELSPAEIELLKYPIGKAPSPQEYTFEEIKRNIERISTFPLTLMKLSADLKPEDLEYKYRPGSWNVVQILHHLADSHINAYVRLKFALTQDHPTIMPYDENLWAVMPDAVSTDDYQVSILIVSGLHHRMSKVLMSLDESAFSKTYFHPAYQKTVTLAQMVATYAWHGEHHIAQIKVAQEKKF